MEVVSKIEVLKTNLSELRKTNQRIGFVATMGALHEGHLQLIDRAKEEDDVVVCSIFVNPKQFDNAKDFEHYPISRDQDIEKLIARNCDFAFFPSVAEIYPQAFEYKTYDFQDLEKHMEGSYRKGHFQGMANVVSRLLKIVKADKAYFGEKDFQQLMIVKRLVEIESISTEIVGHPIVREESGLAMSSRNQRLSTQGREKAVLLHKSLQWTKEHLQTHSLENIQKHVSKWFKEQGLDLEYFVFCEPKDLVPLRSTENVENIRCFVAAYIDEIRLIDNIEMY